MEQELDRIVHMFTEAGDADPGDGGSLVCLGYEVAPVNVATGERLAKPQLLAGAAAMATHALLMKIHAKQLVSQLHG
jgi:hypothetical protein